MKKMILKLIKKIKEHKLFRKFSCLTVACLLLFYMASVSAFAAEGDDVVAHPQETESITDVWSAVMDGIMDLINAAQGVFYSPSGLLDIIYSGDVIEDFPNIDLYPISGFNGEIGDTFTMDVSIDGVTVSGVIEIFGPDFSLPVYGFTFSKVAVSYPSSDPSEIVVFAFCDFSSDSTGLISGWSTSFPPDTFDFVIYDSVGLTFLGTLAVLGVAIAVIMLLVYVVVSFIRLRG